MIVGLDLGTSSLKLLCIENKKTVNRIKVSYDTPSIDNWLSAIKTALGQIDADKIQAISLSSQVGTYIVNDTAIVSWFDPVGKSELDILKNNFSVEDFLEEICMAHPNIISYPIPRLMYAAANYTVNKICQPKDYICEKLTGNYVSDIYSWRGLANTKNRSYSAKMLDFTGVSLSALPGLLSPDSIAGYITESAAREFGVRKGTKVYVGCNDFYASLLGMGMSDSGLLFDITGTSEHLGMLVDNVKEYDGAVCSNFFVKNVLYGVTQSSGKSIDYGLRCFGRQDIDIDAEIDKKPPIFLPYIAGERAPIWNENARGVFFGIGEKTDNKSMWYSVLEGVAFSIYDIYLSLGKSESATAMITCGGASRDDTLNQIKADLFGLPVCVLSEGDTSALGACIIAAVAENIYDDIFTATRELCQFDRVIEPKSRPILAERFELYKKIYNNEKENFEYFRRISK